MLDSGSDGIVGGWPWSVKRLLVHLNLSDISLGSGVLLRAHIQVSIIEGEEFIF